MSLIVLNSIEPTLLYPNLPRYFRYRNAVEQDTNLYAAELGLGRNPKVWRFCWLTVSDGRVRLRGWINNIGDDFTVFYHHHMSNWRQIKGNFETYEEAHDFLVLCGTHVRGD